MLRILPCRITVSLQRLKCHIYYRLQGLNGTTRGPQSCYSSKYLSMTQSQPFLCMGSKIEVFFFILTLDITSPPIKPKALQFWSTLDQCADIPQYCSVITVSDATVLQLTSEKAVTRMDASFCFTHFGV